MYIHNLSISKILAKAIGNLSVLVAIPVMMSSCIYDKYDLDESEENNGDTAYISVAFSFTDDASKGTRAAEWDDSHEDKINNFFNQGISEESAICTDRDVNWIMAYDDQGNYIDSYRLINISSWKNSSTDHAGRNFVAVCEVTGREEQVEKIKNLRIILNANHELGLTIQNGDVAINNLMHQLASGSNSFLFHTDGDGNVFHTMASSMIVGENGEAEAVTRIDEGGVKIFKSIYDARNNPSASLFVERLQSKYTVLFHPDKEGNDRYFVDGNVYDYDNGTSTGASNNLIVFDPEVPKNPEGEELTTQVYYVKEFDINDRIPETFLSDWRASIVGWGINGTESKTYLYKVPGKDRNYTPTGYYYPVRNLWTVDPHYSDPADYPDQYRKAYDETVKSVEENPEIYGLNYMSFKSLTNRSIRHYSAENTFSPTFLTDNDMKNRAQFRCGNTLLIGAQLLIKGFDEDDVFNPMQVDAKGLISSDAGHRVKTKYYMDNIFWSEEAYVNYFSKYLSYNLSSSVEINNKLTGYEDFVPQTVFNPAKDEEKFYVYDGEWRVADYRDFEIHPLYIKGGDGWCLPYPKEDKNNPGYSVLRVKQVDEEKGTGEFTYRPIKMKEFEIFAYGYPVYFAKCYNEGRMYYAQPISDSSGILGAVRNHWYHYEFNSLKNVGISVHNPDQPIVPAVEPNVIGFGFEVQIIPWHIVEEDVNI